jgi:hypothetical protein
MHQHLHPAQKKKNKNNNNNMRAPWYDPWFTITFADDERQIFDVSTCPRPVKALICSMCHV